MNKTFTLLVAVALSFGASAQTWVNWDFTVPADKQEEFNAVWAKFMASETGKALPMCFVSQHEMGEATHNTSISFIGESADALAREIGDTDDDPGAGPHMKALPSSAASGEDTVEGTGAFDRALAGKDATGGADAETGGSFDQEDKEDLILCG